MNPPDQSTVRIRMYRHGLGDCFLLRFPRKDGAGHDYNIVIDCGIIIGADTAKLKAAVDDITKTTGGQIDLLIGTHEHYDHVSGFNLFRSAWDQLKVKQVWLAWTEDKTNDLANQIVKDRAAKVTALRMALVRMAGAGMLSDGQALQAKGIQHLLEFFGEVPMPGADDGNLGLQTALTQVPGGGDGSTGVQGSLTTHDAMVYLASRNALFRDPSSDQPLTLDGVDNLRIYVFGPPVDLKLMKKTLPTKTGHETYGMTTGKAEDSFFAAVSSKDDQTSYSDIQALSFPFDPFFRVSPEEVQDPAGDDFFRVHYGFDPKDADAWRRIDQDWLDVTSELALQLDSSTNNTSLVLAFEIGEPGSGKVLLFPGDAQVGNWLGWTGQPGLQWTLTLPGQAPKIVTSTDLLRRVVFYKVGHHGSHNATLAAQGLELMTDPNLVAMIPVDKGQAIKKGWGEMPFDPLVKALHQKARGRVLVTDDTAFPPQPDDKTLITDEAWQDFKQHVITGENNLYYEYILGPL